MEVKTTICNLDLHQENRQEDTTTIIKEQKMVQKEVGEDLDYNNVLSMLGA